MVASNMASKNIFGQATVSYWMRLLAKGVSSFLDIYRTLISSVFVPYGTDFSSLYVFPICPPYVLLPNYYTVFFISDDNVFKLLRIGNDLLAENLIQKCENYLVKNAVWYSLEKLFKISMKYKLHALHNHVIKQLHCDIGDEMLLEFDTLSYYEQSKILHTLCK